MSRVKIAVVGAGNWGRNHARTVAAATATDLVAICELDSKRREKLRALYPETTVTDQLADALDMADAVIVATPAAHHAEISKKTLERGLPLLVEKPFALSVRDAEEVAELAAHKGVPILVGHLLVFHPAVERLKEMIKRGELGVIHYLYSQRVNLGQVRPDENALWSFGPHDVSVALELLGENPVKVAAHGHSYLQPGIEDVVFLNMEFASGTMAHAQMSWLDPHKERRVTVVGSSKMVTFDDMQVREKLKVYDKGVDRPPEYTSYGESLSIREGDISIPRIPNVEPLAAEVAHFVEMIQDGVSPRSDVRQGIQIVRLLEAATESLRSGGNVVQLSEVGVP